MNSTPYRRLFSFPLNSPILIYLRSNLFKNIPFAGTVTNTLANAVLFPIDKKGESDKIRYTVSGIYYTVN